MKKLLFTIVLLLSVFAAFGQTKEAAYTQTALLIEDDLFDNQFLIEKQAVNLSPNERYSLYNSKKKETAVPFLLNLFLGCGIGSFVQGDKLGGTIGLVGELGFATMYTTGYLLILRKSSSGIMPLLIGAGGLLGVRIYEFVRPFNFTKEYNAVLKDSLLLDSASLSFAPIINPDTEQLGLLIGVRLAL